MIERLKQSLRERYGHPDRVPNIRFLYIDTDPEAVPANPTETVSVLSPRETVLARLNRPSHYLQRESLPPVEGWMPTGTLYKLARPARPAACDPSAGSLFDNTASSRASARKSRRS